MNDINIHPDIENFWKKSGYESIVRVNNKLNDRAVRWWWTASNNTASEIIAVAELEDASDIKHIFNNKYYPTEYMLKIIKLMPFL